MRTKVFCVLLGLLLALPAMAAFAAEKDDRPLSAEELAEFKSQIPGVEAEINSFFNGKLQRNPTQIAPAKFQKYLKAKKKSSSPTRACRRAMKSVTSQGEAYLNSLTSQGWIPVDDPKPIIDYKYKFGISGFKFYCRITVNATVWFIKMPTQAK